MPILNPSSIVNSRQTIGVIALSSPCEPGLFNFGIRHLESFGFKTKVALDPSRHYGETAHLFSSDSPKARARALEDLFLDKEVAAILSVRGAYGCMEVLPELDFGLIAKNPKRIIGFSDTTAMLCACYAKAHIPAVHGPSLTSAFGKAHENENARRSSQCLIDFLTGAMADPFKDLEIEHFGKKANATGPVIGGNLSILSSMVGTPWEPDYKGHILFLEEVGEKPYRVHRMLMQLKLAGRLDGLAGVILGSFKNCEHEKGFPPSCIEAIRDVLLPLEIPVAGWIPSGHSDWCLPVPFGVEARIGENKFEILAPRVH